MEFNIDRGCRQGDPIASLLFIVVIEIMCIKIRASDKVKGIKIGKHSAKLSMYADDSTIFLENNEIELRALIRILNDFYRLSGLQIHMEKTQCV